MKYIVEKSLETLVREVVFEFLNFNDRYNYRFMKREWSDDIINFLVDDYSSMFSENEVLDFNLEERLWDELRYGLHFAKGKEECNKLLLDKYYDAVYEYCKDMVEEKFENSAIEISEELIDAEINKAINEGALLSYSFIDFISGGDDYITLLNIYEDDKVFLAIREPY